MKSVVGIMCDVSWCVTVTEIVCKTPNKIHIRWLTKATSMHTEFYSFIYTKCVCVVYSLTISDLGEDLTINNNKL